MAVSTFERPEQDLVCEIYNAVEYMGRKFENRFADGCIRNAFGYDKFILCATPVEIDASSGRLITFMDVIVGLYAYRDTTFDVSVGEDLVVHYDIKAGAFAYFLGEHVLPGLCATRIDVQPERLDGVVLVCAQLQRSQQAFRDAHWGVTIGGTTYHVHGGSLQAANGDAQLLELPPFWKVDPEQRRVTWHTEHLFFKSACGHMTPYEYATSVSCMTDSELSTRLLDKSRRILSKAKISSVVRDVYAAVECLGRTFDVPRFYSKNQMSMYARLCCGYQPFALVVHDLTVNDEGVFPHLCDTYVGFVALRDTRFEVCVGGVFVCKHDLAKGQFAYLLGDRLLPKQPMFEKMHIRPAHCIGDVQVVGAHVSNYARSVLLSSSFEFSLNGATYVIEPCHIKLLAPGAGVGDGVLPLRPYWWELGKEMIGGTAKATPASLLQRELLCGKARYLCGGKTRLLGRE